LRFPLWEDECFLCANLIDRDYRDLLLPLDYNQACPFLFLWLQKLIVSVVGFHEFGLRFAGFSASVASLILFRHLAVRVLAGPALILAVAAFSVGYPSIRYGAEAKPYGTDLLAAVVLLTLYAQWRHTSGQVRWLCLTAMTVLPLAMLSFPAAFVGGGISLAALVALWRETHVRPARTVCAWMAINVMLCSGFLVLWWVSAQAQNEHTGAVMRWHWSASFPPSTGFQDLARWLVVTHASDLSAWPLGGPNGASTATFLLCLCGVATCLRERRWDLLNMCLLPAAINLVAAALRLYPYGGHMRLTIYLGPAVCLLFGVGLSDCLRRVQVPRAQARLNRLALIVLAAVGVGSVLRDVARPYKARHDERARAFAQWFWPSAQFDGEVLCLQTDLQKHFVPRGERPCCSVQYLCNQHIYSPRHVQHRRPDLDRVRDGTPLRCVQFRFDADRLPFDDEAFNAWLSEMQLRYQLIGRDTYPFPRCDRRDRVVSVDFIDVLTFGQRHSGDTAPAMAIRDATTARAGVEGTERIHRGTSADPVIR
jgi:hypothetical protein